MSSVKITRTVEEVRAQVRDWRKNGLKVGLIPTMGALHHGHLSLVREIQEITDRVVVSIFVNPKQFGPNEDFNKYPRQEEDDLKKLEEIGCDVLYAPGVEEIYPQGFLANVSISEITTDLCGAERPGHFDGVTTVVTKLLLQCLPDVVVFGKKDYQQYIVLKQLVRDLDIPMEVVGGTLIRDEDGLATSSRNVYLSENERRIALEIPKTLQKIIDDIEGGQSDFDALLEKGRRHLLEAGFDDVQYLEIRDNENLGVINDLKKPARILVAAVIGKTRLIDNMAVRAVQAP